MAVKLTEGAISMLSGPDWDKMEAKPILQVVDIRVVKTQSGSGDDRYRVVLSDGTSSQQGMLATQQNELVRSQRLQRGSIIQLTEFNCSKIRERFIVIIINLDVIVDTCDIIGEPKLHPPRPVNEPPTSMMSSNQPPRTMGNSQNLTGVSRPNITANYPTYPPTSMPIARMQSFNQPPTTMGSPQTFSPSVPRPNTTVNSPLYPPQQEHNVGLQHSYGNSPINHPSMHSRPDSPAAISRPPANNFTRSVQSTYNQPPSMYTNRAPIAKNDAPPRVIPIAALNPYQGRWTIKARVTAKAEIRNYKNNKGEGKVFSFDLLDSDGGEIRATCFNAVAEQFYEQIAIGKIYYISKGSVKPAQKAFNHLKNDHEITLDSTSTIQLCVDDDGSIPQQQFHFRSIAEIEGLDNNTVLDIIGVVSSINPASSLLRKNGIETMKQTLHLKDMSGRSVELTLWGNFCNTEGQKLQSLCDSGIFPVLALKSVRVSEFIGKQIGTISTSQLFIEPDFPQALELKTWFENIGKNTPSVSLSREMIPKTEVRKTISQIKEEKLGTSEKPDWITISATVWVLKPDAFCYTACPLMYEGRVCNKKVVNNGDGNWHCDRCMQTVDHCDYRYLLSFQIQDHTGLHWVTAFQEAGEEIMGVSAKELYNLKHEEQDEERFMEIFRNVVYSKFDFKLKVKEETYQDNPTVKCHVAKAERVKASSETSFLLDLIKKDNSVSVGAKLETQTPVTTTTITPFAQQGVGQMGQGQFGNEYGGMRIGNSCNSCGGVGHSSVNCPSVVGNGRGYNNNNNLGGGHNINSVGSVSGNSGVSGVCYKCNKSGHLARDCPGASNVSSGYGGGNMGVSGECFKCHQTGHWARDCPGVSNVSSGYGSGNVASGRYGNASGQYVGGY